MLLGEPSDGRTDRRHLSMEELSDFLQRVPKPGAPKPMLQAGEKARYELVVFRDGTFYFEWIKVGGRRALISVRTPIQVVIPFTKTLSPVDSRWVHDRLLRVSINVFK